MQIPAVVLGNGASPCDWRNHYRFIMTSTIVSLTGYILEANIKHPVESFEDEKYKYTLKVQPSDIGAFDRHRDQADKLRVLNMNPHLSGLATPKPDRIEDGCKVCFETLYRPTLTSWLKDKSDDELYGLFVKVQGHMQLHKDGNAFISFHCIDPLEPDKEQDIDIDSDADDFDF